MPRNRNVPAPLPVLEQGLYWLVECFTLLYMFYSLYHASEDAKSKNEPIQIDDGWAIIGRPMDVADFEWTFWTSYFPNLLPWMCGHALLSCVLTRCGSSLTLKAVSLTLYGVVVTCHLLGLSTVALFCVLPVVLHLVARRGSAAAVWLTALLFLTALNLWENSLFQWAHRHYPDSDVDTWFSMCIFVWGGLFQRATAFALECVWARQARSAPAPPAEEEVVGGEETADKADRAASERPPSPDPLPEVPGWTDLFFYTFYFPLFFTGPLLIYNKFHKQFREPQPWSSARVRDIAWKLARVVTWAATNVVLLHFVYPHAINANSAVLARQSRVTVAAIGYMLGQLFMLKYLVLFGLCAQLARLEGFEPPGVPACISYVYCYSDMWRSFDRGLYDFMTRYIFIPFGGSRAGLAHRLAGSVLCFAFVYYWHGAEYYLFLWCLLNFLETGLEQVGAWLEGTALVRSRVYSRLSPGAVRRVRAALSVPVFLMAVFGIFYFFGGTASGMVFLRKLLIDIPWSSLAVFLALVYCAVQNAMELERLGMTKLRCRRAH